MTILTITLNKVQDRGLIIAHAESVVQGKTYTMDRMIGNLAEAVDNRTRRAILKRHLIDVATAILDEALSQDEPMIT